MASRRSNGGDDRRRRKNDSGKAKSAKSGHRTDAATKVDCANWQLKSPADSGRAKHTVRPVVSSRVSSKHSTKKPATSAEQLNGQAVCVGDERTKTGRGQTSTELKKRRSTQRHNSNNALTVNHDDWLASTSIVYKKPERVAVSNATNTMFTNNGCCVLM